MENIDRTLNIPPPQPSKIIECCNFDDYNDGRYEEATGSNDGFELWTFRLPVEMDVTDLHGVQLVLNNNSVGGSKPNKNRKQKKLIDTSVPIKDKFILSEGSTVENETFRVLIPDSNINDDDKSSSSSSSSSDDDEDSSSDVDEDEGKNNLKTKKTDFKDFLLRPSAKMFTRHYNVTSALYPKKTEMQLAPLIGPNPTDNTLRRAYSSIPQRTGLKRRWMPLGCAYSSSGRDKAKEIQATILERTSTKKKHTDCLGDEFHNVKDTTKEKKKKRSAVDSNNGKNTRSSKSKRIKTDPNGTASGDDGDDAHTQFSSGNASSPKNKKIKKELNKSAKKKSKKKKKNK